MVAQERMKVSKKVSVEATISVEPVQDSYSISIGGSFISHADPVKTADTGKLIGYRWIDGKIYENIESVIDAVYDDVQGRIVRYLSDFPH
ncbi:MAG: hypothetical protein H6662_15425 [Ardenticatenaceae bacterium]|nr:hypothetical protein [Anaerolineales bacterium]MCB8922977.1 hypothetical protein [Ardenticatenaceae bacterium]